MPTMMYVPASSDPLQRWLRLKDADRYAEASNALDPVIALARDTGVHVMAIHHERKSGGDGIDSVLGSHAFSGGFDTILSLSRAGHQRFLASAQRGGEGRGGAGLAGFPGGSSLLNPAPRRVPAVGYSVFVSVARRDFLRAAVLA